MPSEKTKLTIEFDNPRALHHFALWLCEQGEQGYWDWMEVREQEEKGSITATNFRYHGPYREDGKYGKYMEDNVIRTKCGRMSAEWDDEVS